MQCSLLVAFVMLTCASATRIKTASSFFSSKGDRCKILAPYICQPLTWKANEPKVRQCCHSKDLGDEELRKACCQICGLSEDGMEETSLENEKPLVKQDTDEQLDREDGIEPISDELIEKLKPEVTQVFPDQPDVKLEPMAIKPAVTLKGDDALSRLMWDQINTFSESVRRKWEPSLIIPNVNKRLLKAFLVKKKSSGMDWGVSCVDACADTCAWMGGKCQAIQSAQDCETAAKEASLEFFAYNLANLQSKHMHMSEMSLLPRGCFTTNNGPNTNLAWNAPPIRGYVNLNNVCGCYM